MAGAKIARCCALVLVLAMVAGERGYRRGYVREGERRYREPEREYREPREEREEVMLVDDSRRPREREPVYEGESRDGVQEWYSRVISETHGFRAALYTLYMSATGQSGRLSRGRAHQAVREIALELAPGDKQAAVEDTTVPEEEPTEELVSRTPTSPRETEIQLGGQDSGENTESSSATDKLAAVKALAEEVNRMTAQAEKNQDVIDKTDKSAGRESEIDKELDKTVKTLAKHTRNKMKAA
eukprot:TRINITY_DN12684_c0_g2_i1.p1 TRINITY_DN12684_c0_g2~~TRINITY_DN12684_c0_g2_i1.p1  ORF type:complete len:242 (-),score=46.28 TRINITY_DN12684_c0_g2_i1:335-1060(-)